MIWIYLTRPKVLYLGPLNQAFLKFGSFFLAFKISVQNCITISQCTVVCYTVLIAMYHSTLLYWCWWTSTVFSLESVTDLLTEPVLEVLSDLKSEEFMKSSMKLFYQFLPQDIWSSSQVIWLLSDSIWFFNWLIFTSEMLCLLANSMSKLFNFTWKYIMNTATKNQQKEPSFSLWLTWFFFVIWEFVLLLFRTCYYH